MCISVSNNHFSAHISLLFLFFLFLPNTPHSSSIITVAAICFDELILDTEMYEQSLGIHSCVCGEMYPSLAPESSSPRHLANQTRTCMGTVRSCDWSLEYQFLSAQHEPEPASLWKQPLGQHRRTWPLTSYSGYNRTHYSCLLKLHLLK